MGETCSRCGSNNDVQQAGEVYLCATCRGEMAGIDPRLKFARWAVEHGKITDFPGKVDELFNHSAEASQH